MCIFLLRGFNSGSGFLLIPFLPTASGHVRNALVCQSAAIHYVSRDIVLVSFIIIGILPISDLLVLCYPYLCSPLGSSTWNMAAVVCTV